MKTFKAGLIRASLFVNLAILLNGKRLQNGNLEDGSCGRGDLVAIVNAETEESGNVLLLCKSFRTCINENYCRVLFKGVVFKVSEDIADFFLSAHTERNKPVAHTPSTADKRET